MLKFLVIQTAFIGDVVLATAVVEQIRASHPDATIHFLVRKGNEGLLIGNPHITKIYIWQKKSQKLRNLFKIAAAVRKAQYSHIINLQRFAATGFITWLSGAVHRAGFNKNPFAFCYTHKATHTLGKVGDTAYLHEVERNAQLLKPYCNMPVAMPRLYPSAEDSAFAAQYANVRYVCIAPSSVWETKRFPAGRWIDLMNALPPHFTLFLLGGKEDKALCDSIANAVKGKNIVNTAGNLSFLQSAALMAGAAMNYSGDSAPLHIASAMNAPITAVFCSTIPAYGFTPLSSHARIVETTEHLPCRPCGIHGKNTCPKAHYACATTITTQQLLWWNLTKN